jgi:uncharacterized protein (TIGR02145 family)
MLAARADFAAEKTGKAEGLRIFNLTTKCVNTWNGTVWIQECGPYGPAPAAPTATDQTLCPAAKISDLVATGEAGATFSWYSEETGGSPLAGTTPLTSGTYYVSQTTASGESERTAVAVTLEGSPVPLTLTLSATDLHLRSQKANAANTNCMDLATTITAYVDDPNATLAWSIAKKYNYATMAAIDDVAFVSGTTAAVEANTATTLSLTAKDLEYLSPFTGAYTVTVTATPSGSCNTVTQTTIDISVGCGARDITGSTWLSFIPHNLGADQTLDPFVWVCTSSDEGDGVSDDGTADIKGDLYQWGRYTDGHENRQSTYSTTGHPLLANYDNEVLAYKTSGTAFTYTAFYQGTSTRNYDWISDGATQNTASLRKGWDDATPNFNQAKTENDPCPDGWKVPSQAQWGSIYQGGTTDGAPNSATANSWTWTDTDEDESGDGYQVGAALFLPAAGYRYDRSGALYFVGSVGYYWSSTWDNTTFSYYLHFNSSIVRPGNHYTRAQGFSVRCVADPPIAPFVASSCGVTPNSGTATTFTCISDPNAVEYEWFVSGEAGSTITTVPTVTYASEKTAPDVTVQYLYEPSFLKPTMIDVAGGAFTIGAAVAADNDGAGSNGAVTGNGSVTLSSFKMSETPITQAQYAAVMGVNPSDFQCAGTGKTSGGMDYRPSSDLPVEMVNWYDAAIFCNRLSIMENKTPCYSITDYYTAQELAALEYDDSEIPTSTTHTNYSTWNANFVCDWGADGYRLPTEAEWEFAARGGNLSLSPSFYYSGSNTANDVAWYSGNNGTTGNTSAPWYGTKAVKQKAANALDLYDMSGNVYEWCWNWYATSYAAADKGTNPVGGTTGFYRVIRGGYWFNTAPYCRVSYRTYTDPSGRYGNIGFRVVLAP